MKLTFSKAVKKISTTLFVLTILFNSISCKMQEDPDPEILIKDLSKLEKTIPLQEHGKVNLEKFIKFLHLPLKIISPITQHKNYNFITQQIIYTHTKRQKILDIFISNSMMKIILEQNLLMNQHTNLFLQKKDNGMQSTTKIFLKIIFTFLLQQKQMEQIIVLIHQKKLQKH